MKRRNPRSSDFASCLLYYYDMIKILGFQILVVFRKVLYVLFLEFITFVFVTDNFCTVP